MESEGRTLTLGGACGLASVLGLLASLPLAPPWPMSSADTGEVLAYFQTHREGFLRQVWVSSLSVVMLVPWGAALRASMSARHRELESGAIWGGILLFVASFLAWWIPWVAIAFRPDPTADTARILYDLGMLGQFGGVGAALALHYLGLTVGILRGSALPRWLAVLTGVAIPLNILLVGATQVDGWRAPTGPLGFGSIGWFTLGMFAISISMIVRGRALTAAERSGS